MASVCVSVLYIAVILILLDGFINVCDGKDCNKPLEQVARCYTENHLTFPANISTSMSYVNEQMCRKPDDAAKAMSCYLQRRVDCIGANFGGYLASPNKTKEVVAIACRKITLFNEKCSKSQSPKFSSCVQNKLIAIAMSSDTDFRQKMCKTHEATYSCMRPALGPCGCATYQVMEETIKGPLWPALCSQPQLDSYHCDPNNPNVFLDSGSQMVPSLLLWLIIILTILLF
ncbi:uncharacterized protein LOC131940927 [Physella acuta]|uniref:uncharacterized protein LOC131940927 n=1 Tax=Physella acuta TaxID=109671 RepID=UPI0027DCC6F8|nr:uncharacterized protein LOC131940927 [Physella acuta]